MTGGSLLPSARRVPSFKVKSAHLLEVLVRRRVRQTVVVEQAHFLAEQAVQHVRSRVLPLHQPRQLTTQRGAQVHRPVIRVQGYLTREETGDGAVRTGSMSQISEGGLFNVPLISDLLWDPSTTKQKCTL